MDILGFLCIPAINKLLQLPLRSFCINFSGPPYLFSILVESVGLSIMLFPDPFLILGYFVIVGDELRCYGTTLIAGPFSGLYLGI